MATLLYIESSPRKKRSASIAVARTFLEEYTQTHPNDRIDEMDLWQMALPPLTEDVLGAKYAILHGQNPTEEDRRNWLQVEQTIARFKAADKYVISLPMWNFSIPYVLKHLIDVITQPTYTFSYDPATGYTGLVTGKPVVLIYARGGAYAAGTDSEGYDLQTRYMQVALGFIGITDQRSIIVEPTLAPGEKEKKVAEAQVEAKRIAAAF